MSQPNRLAADAAHQFGGIAIDRQKPLSFKLDGQRIDGFVGDTVLTALLANGIDTLGEFAGAPLALTSAVAPLVSERDGPALPIDRLPAVGGLELSTLGRRKRDRRATNTLGLVIAAAPDPGWAHEKPEATLAADFIVIGAGVAGLAAAETAAADGRRVILVERQAWLGGDARYFGAVGDEESPEGLTTRLADQITARANITVLLRAEALMLSGRHAIVHHIDVSSGVARGRIVLLEAERIVLATGARQRLPVFAGNRLPGVIPAMEAYHLAKRYGVTLGPSAIVTTQSNHGYRLALRLSDAGVAIGRVVDPRVHPQSRFVDFAKAGGLTLASGQYPFSARRAEGGGLTLGFANTNTTQQNASFNAGQLVAAGSWQPDLGLWMLAGGSTRWSESRGAMVASGRIDGVALAGAVIGARSMKACAASGRAAVQLLFGGEPSPIEDAEIGTDLETPDAPTTIAPSLPEPPAFLDAGSSLAARPVEGKPTRPPMQAQSHVLSLGDVAAAVQLGFVAAVDADAIAAERGVPGAPLTASQWAPAMTASPAGDAPWLARRFGTETTRLTLVVDRKRQFDIGALVYSNIGPRRPDTAVGVIVETAPVGGTALMSKATAETLDRFIIETVKGPSPARRAS